MTTTKTARAETTKTTAAAEQASPRDDWSDATRAYAERAEAAALGLRP